MTYTVFAPLILGDGPTEQVGGEGETNDAFTNALLTLMESNPDQKRAVLTPYVRLDYAAQQHAEDMARRNFFSHENPDGIWPNQRVRDTGYELPAEWPNDRNYCESICAGQPTPQEAWNAWMHSESHKTHLLGLTGFFAAQVNVGVGYAHNSGSVYQHYWVIVSAPLER